MIKTLYEYNKYMHLVVWKVQTCTKNKRVQRTIYYYQKKYWGVNNIVFDNKNDQPCKSCHIYTSNANIFNKTYSFHLYPLVWRGSQFSLDAQSSTVPAYWLSSHSVAFGDITNCIIFWRYAPTYPAYMMKIGEVQYCSNLVLMCAHRIPGAR